MNRYEETVRPVINQTLQQIDNGTITLPPPPKKKSRENSNKKRMLFVKYL